MPFHQDRAYSSRINGRIVNVNSSGTFSASLKSSIVAMKSSTFIALLPPSKRALHLPKVVLLSDLELKTPSKFLNCSWDSIMFEELLLKTPWLFAIDIFSKTFEFWVVTAVSNVLRTGFALSNADRFYVLVPGIGFTALLAFACGFFTSFPLCIAARLFTTELSDLDEFWLLTEAVLGLLLILSN